MEDTGTNAEPVFAYRDVVQQRYSNQVVLAGGCIDQTRCYLTTDLMTSEGGYEVDGFQPFIGIYARAKIGCEARMFEHLCATRRASAAKALQ